MIDNSSEHTPYLTITPLGGLGEIGMNCQLWDNGSTALLIDCGLMFPNDLQMGIDLVIPPLESVLTCKERLRGIILTHGHEDHIGAVPWLATFIEHLHVYGSPFTLELLKRKLVERELDERVTLHTVTAGCRVDFDGIGIRFIPVSHSIPQSFAVAAETPVGKILHTGDFKIEPHPTDGVGTDMNAFSAFAEPDGIRLLLCDSTNAESPAHTPSESLVAEQFDRIFSEAPGRIIITTFSSHIDRVRMIFGMAARYNREVIVSGRSLIANIEAARDILNLPFPDELYTDQNLPSLEPERTVILATGSQGEPLSALARIVRGEHRRLALQPDDTLIMSSRVIPGNAQAVNRLINQMYRMGATVFHNDISTVHVSGHAGGEEIGAVIDAVLPQYFIPIHGEYRHMIRNRALAQEHGIAPDDVIILEDGIPLTLFPDTIRIEKQIPAAPILIDGKGVGDVGEIVLHERQLMADDGMLVAAVVRNSETGDVKYGPVLRSKGLVFEEDNKTILEEAQRIAAEACDETPIPDTQRLHDRLRSVLRSYFRKRLGRDPVVVPLIVDM